jgi:hypothetical protein
MKIDIFLESKKNIPDQRKIIVPEKQPACYPNKLAASMEIMPTNNPPYISLGK